MRRTVLLLCTPVIAMAQVTLVQAVEAALARHPQLSVERERASAAQSLVKVERGRFDARLEALGQQGRTNFPLTGLQQLQVSEAGFGVNNQTSNTTTGVASASKLLRNGVQFTGAANLTRITDNLVQTQGVNLSTLRFEALVPLQRNRGRAVVAGEETTARIQSEAALLDVNHAAAALIADAATRYWELVAARQSLDVWTQAEARGENLVTVVRTLIESDRLPRSELQQVLANLAGRSSNRAGAEQRLIEATQALGLAMGLPAEELTNRLEASDPLPPGPEALTPSLSRAEVSEWVARALERRADYLAIRKRQGALSIRRNTAANLLKPQVDFRVSAGYSSLSEGRRPDRFVLSPFYNPAGVDVSAGISYSLPMGRHAAQGQLEFATSTARQNELNSQDLARSITSAVVAGIGAYTNAVIRLEQARTSVDASDAALAGEREKLRLGAGSVVDLLTLEDRLNNARLAMIDANLNYATLLARLRFATGTILEPGREAHTVEKESFRLPPWQGAPR